MSVYTADELLAALPEEARSLFRLQVMEHFDRTAEGEDEDAWAESGRWPWRGFFPPPPDDFRSASVWEEDGVWVVHINEDPGGYYVDEFRFRDGVWYSVEGETGGSTRTYYEVFPEG